MYLDYILSGLFNSGCLGQVIFVHTYIRSLFLYRGSLYTELVSIWWSLYGGLCMVVSVWCMVFVWWPLYGGLHMVVSVWWSLYGGLCLVVSVWWPLYGGLCMVVSVWWSLYGGLCIELVFDTDQATDHLSICIRT